MDAESAVIQQQMEETRQSLSEKLEALEEKVTEDMQEAGQVVTESVDTMKETVKETVDAMQETVASVKESVEETVANVKGSVEETFTSIKDTFDLGLQVREHPWLMMGASVCAGCWIGSWIGNERGFSASRRQNRWEPMTARAAGEPRWGAEPRVFGGPAMSEEAVERPTITSGPVAPATTQQPGHGWHWLHSLLGAIQPEIETLRQMAVMSAADAVTDILANAAPPNMKPQLAGMVNRVAHRFTDTSGDSPRRG